MTDGKCSTTSFLKLAGGERFIYQNVEYVKLHHGHDLGGLVDANAVDLDKGNMAHIEKHEEVIHIRRSY